MADESCFTCNYIQTTFAAEIDRGSSYRCSRCGRLIGGPPAGPPAEQFWLLTGEVPSGPFTVAQIHAELAAGRATWLTPACPLGGSTWVPLNQTSGVGTVAGPIAGDPPDPTPAEMATSPARPAATAAAPPSTVPPPLSDSRTLSTAPTPTPEDTERKRGRFTRATAVGLVVVALLGAAYGVYEWVRPLTATEVCKKLDAAKTADEAKKYGTPRMHPLLDAYFADKSTDPNDTSEWTREVDGPRPDTKLVGFRGTTYVPAAGRRVRVEGHFVVVKADGWKADDAVITSVEGAALPGPVSLVEEHAPPATAAAACRRFNAADTPAEAKKYATPRMHRIVDELTAAPPPDPGDTFDITQESDGGNPTTRLVGFRGSWYDAGAGRRQRVEGHFRVIQAGGWKIDDMVFTGVGGTPLPKPTSLVDESARSAAPAKPLTAADLDRISKFAKEREKSHQYPGVRLTKVEPPPWYVQIDPRKNNAALYACILLAGAVLRVVWNWLTARSASPEGKA